MWNQVILIILRYGGIVGYLVSEDGTVRQCYNNAQGEGIYGKYSICGGIVGGSAGSIEDCYNLSKVIGSNHVGGICGSQWQANTSMRNLYNKGIIVGQASTGGIIGRMANISCNNFVNIGVIDKSSGAADIKDICGIWAENVTWEQGTWLESTQLSETDMKTWTTETIQSKLGNNFVKDVKGINNGLPILKWQEE